MPDTYEIRADLRRMLASGYPFDTPQGRDDLVAVFMNMLDVLDGVRDRLRGDDDDEAGDPLRAVLMKHRQVLMDLLPNEVFMEINLAMRE